MWRSVVISRNGNLVENYTIRFTGPSELVWEMHARIPGGDERSGTRYEYVITPAGKLVLTPVRKLLPDGIEVNHLPAAGDSPIEFTILPLDKQCRSFQLLQHNARGRKVFDAVFRNEPNGAATG